MSDCTSPAQQVRPLEDEQVLVQCPESEHGLSRELVVPPACQLPRHGDARCAAVVRLTATVGPGVWHHGGLTGGVYRRSSCRPTQSPLLTSRPAGHVTASKVVPALVTGTAAIHIQQQLHAVHLCTWRELEHKCNSTAMRNASATRSRIAGLQSKLCMLLFTLWTKVTWSDK